MTTKKTDTADATDKVVEDLKQEAAAAPAPETAPATAAPVMNRPCKDCAYWIGDKAPTGQCRRFPPQIVPAAERRTDTRFPVTGANDWCGEFAAR